MLDHIKHAKEVRGIIQIGANSAQEMPFFRHFTNNIVLIEPIPQLFNELKNRFPDLIVIPTGLGSNNCKMDLYLASNNGEPSSVLKPKNHISHYPSISFEGSIQIEISRFDCLTEKFGIDMNNFNVLVSDAQGYDLEAIKGFGDLINFIDLIIVEYINSNLYENDSSLDDINNYLKQFNFELLYTFDENSGAGNAVFKKLII